MTTRDATPRALISAVEACYAVEQSFGAWLDGVHRSLSPIIDHGMGTCAYRYDLRGPHFQIHEIVQSNVRVDLDGLSRAMSSVTADYVAKSWRALLCGTSSEVPGFEQQPVVPRFFHPVGVADSLVINALDAQGVGVWVGAFLPRTMRVAPQLRATYSKLGSHIAAGYRLYRRLMQREQRAVEAVLSPTGRLLHAAKGAQDARSALVAATVAIDRARAARGRRNDAEGLSRWRSLVAARWSLVDQFESDGKRYLVARANTPDLPDIPALTSREAQVLAHAALGHHNKLVAYDLGIAPSTVRVLLARAARKLGTGSRHETIERFLTLTRPPDAT